MRGEKREEESSVAFCNLLLVRLSRHCASRTHDCHTTARLANDSQKSAFVGNKKAAQSQAAFPLFMADHGMADSKNSSSLSFVVVDSADVKE